MLDGTLVGIGCSATPEPQSWSHYRAGWAVDAAKTGLEGSSHRSKAPNSGP